MESIFKPGDLVQYVPEAFGHRDKYIGIGYVESVDYDYMVDSYIYVVVTFNTIKQSAKNFAEHHLGEKKILWPEHHAIKILKKIS